MAKVNVFLDMDCVIADFIGGVINLLPKSDRPSEAQIIDAQREIGWDFLSKFFGSKKEVWEAIEKDSEGFWCGLKKTEYADMVVDSVKSGEVYVLTSVEPKRYRIAAYKYKWLTMHYPELADKMICTKYKGLLGRFDGMLIDDSPDNIIDFINEGGGSGVLWPQHYNMKSLGVRCNTKMDFTAAIGVTMFDIETALKDMQEMADEAEEIMKIKEPAVDSTSSFEVGEFKMLDLTDFDLEDLG